jgi:tetratricopeptide (TPR) repeat protein
MIVDDLQLVDPSTLELLQLWSGQLEQHKCLLVLVHRSGFEHGLTGADQTTRISLSSLGRGESREIVESIATGQQNLSTVIDDILNRAEGTPLYLQELTKMVLQARVAELAGQTERSGTPGAGAYLPDIPGSLQDLLLARLDQLAEARYIAQVAATIGRSFEVDVLVAVADKPEQDVLAALDMLVRADLVGKRSFQNRRIYEFQHALMRDAAYSTLLSSTRRALHMKIAGVYETGFQDQIQSNPEILAYHFQQANMVEEAIRYFQQAGHRQARQSAHREAASHAHEALDLLATLPASQKNHEIEVDLQLMLGDALTATYGYAAEGTGDAYRRAHELCVENPASPHSLPAVYGLWDYHFVGCDGARALELAREMLDDAVASGNTLQEMTARGMLTQNLTTIGKFEDAIRHAARALDLYRGGIDTYRNLNYGEHPLIAAQCFMAWALWWTGKPDQALSRIETGLSEARVLGHSNTTVLALIFCAAIHRWRGEVALTEQLADEAIDYSAELDMGFWQPEPLALKAWAVSQAGDHATALDLLAASDAAWRDSDESTHILSHLSVLSGHVFMNAGRPKEALAAAERGIAVGTEIAETWHASELHWLRAASQLALGASVAETCASFETALQIAKAQNARSIELRVATTLAQQPSDGSGPGETRSPLSEIYASFDEGLETRDLQSAARLL